MINSSLRFNVTHLYELLHGSTHEERAHKIYAPSSLLLFGIDPPTALKRYERAIPISIEPIVRLLTGWPGLSDAIAASVRTCLAVKFVCSDAISTSIMDDLAAERFSTADSIYSLLYSKREIIEPIVARKPETESIASSTTSSAIIASVEVVTTLALNLMCT